jgi:hypothetical protein
MSADLRSLAIRFADLWAVDPHQMVDEIYAADILMESMANPARVIDGAADLHALERQLAAKIPDHRHELIRVVVGDDVACLETMVVAPRSGEYAPACVWWWIDADGFVGAEVGWFDWDVRTTNSAIAHGTVPAGPRAGGAHDHTWYRRVADDDAHGWAHDPTGAATLARFAPDCTSARVGQAESRGVDRLALDRASQLVEIPVPGRRMEIQQVLGEGAVVAMLLVLGDARRVTRGTVVLTLDADGLISSERRYWDWTKAAAIGAAGARRTVGSPGWSLDARGT